MSTLQILLPPLAQFGEDPAFRAWLAHGDCLPGLADARDTTLRECFRFAGTGIPAAALRRLCHADDARTGTWLCADPAYVRSEATGARLLAWPMADLSATEAAELARALRPLLGDAGAPLEVDTPAEWCVRLMEGAPHVEFMHPSLALGASLLECLPAGDTGRKWRRLFNEAQIALHAHPVNAARAAGGKHPVNALWFWGAGTLPESVETSLRVVASRDDVVRGLAKTAGVACIDPLPQALDAQRQGGDALLDLGLPAHADGTAQWHAHFKRWLRKRRFEAMTLTFADGQRFRVRHVHRLRFWRRA